MYHFPSPPHGWSAYDYTTSPSGAQYSYYVPPFGPAPTNTSPRSKRHSYRASYSAARDPWHSSPLGGNGGGYTSHGYYEPEYNTSPSSRKFEYVSPGLYDGYSSNNHQGRSKSWKTAPRHSSKPSHPSHNHSFMYTGSTPLRSQKRSVFPEPVDDAFGSPSYDDPFVSYFGGAGHFHGADYSSQRYTTSKQRQQQQPRRKQQPRPTTDQYFYYSQVPPVYDEPAAESPKRSRARRASTSTRTPQKPRPSPTARPPPKATEEDAIRAGIPAGYSIKNWDPTEAPILLLGSVFDANSLGKWIYDWTVFHHGASTPMADVAGDLWLLLIKLAGKVKRADECAPRIRSIEAREVVEDFLESGERLWARFKKLLKACEHYMWKAAKRENGGAKGSVLMGRNAGCEFVDSIFGRDRELENTEKLMNSIRLWSMRFDVNCEDILRRPSAA